MSSEPSSPSMGASADIVAEAIIAVAETGLTELRREIDALPALLVAEESGDTGADRKADGAVTAAAPSLATPLQVISRQGRLILRLSAAAESLEARYRDLAAQQKEQSTRLEVAEGEIRAARLQGRLMALEAIRLMDALDWVQQALAAREHPLAAEVSSAQRDCLRRLAALGVNEIPVEIGGEMDGRLHEGLDAVTAPNMPQYRIIEVVRRGWQIGPDILRRAGVITAA